eukprot:CAMPEP_0179110974 /NCGR_PEP_ID=MMETSP0796-20121207/51815_1 /TAXON_ID=73915 /ORGANISM="Pyrodinium bahamense, Strain pbaha01" /LENGTH=149 /DNA_ID=CAMNT_0020809119 /DNA_START=173 /DNA_END=623 /DNA_ORIENTATION=-
MTAAARCTGSHPTSRRPWEALRLQPEAAAEPATSSSFLGAPAEREAAEVHDANTELAAGEVYLPKVEATGARGGDAHREAVERGFLRRFGRAADEAGAAVPVQAGGQRRLDGEGQALLQCEALLRRDLHARGQVRTQARHESHRLRRTI